MTPPLYGWKQRRTKKPVDESESGELKSSLKLNIQKTKIMASSPITSRQIDGETTETLTVFIFLGSKITADGEYSHEIKRHLLLGRRVMTNLDSILKSRDITLLTKLHIVKAMVSPVVMHGCESEWTLGVGNGHGGLACCDSWGSKESDMTERLIWSDLIWCPKDSARFFLKYTGHLTLLLQMRKLKLREIKSPFHCHTASRQRR